MEHTTNTHKHTHIHTRQHRRETQPPLPHPALALDPLPPGVVGEQEEEPQLEEEVRGAAPVFIVVLGWCGSLGRRM